MKNYMEVLSIIDTLKKEVLDLAFKNGNNKLMELYEQIDTFFMERMKLFEELFLNTKK